MCYPRIKEGLNPGCADACPTGAITFGEREELITVARDRISKQPGRYIDHIYGEHEFGGTSWMVLAGIPLGQLDLFEGATHTPIPEMGSGFLSVVPLVVTMYPGLLAGFYAFSKRKEKLSRQEKEAAVAEALARTDEETKKKLSDAATKATKEREKAVAQAVKKALDEAKAAEKEGSK
jgi:ferredoxin